MLLKNKHLNYLVIEFIKERSGNNKGIKNQANPAWCHGDVGGRS
jgi:hypothetical protein